MTTREWMTLVALTALITAGSVGAAFVLMRIADWFLG
jgi:hypothetical protein